MAGRRIQIGTATSDIVERCNPVTFSLTTTHIGKDMKEIMELKIEGMHCDGCVRRVTALLRKVEDVEVDSVVVGAAKVKASNEARADLVKAIESGGFRVTG